MHRRNRIKVPICLCQHTYATKAHLPLRLLLLLKLFSDGHIHKKDARIKFIKENYFNDVRTYQRHVKKLKEFGWIWENYNRGILHFISFDKIKKKQNLKGNRVVEVNLDDLTHEDMQPLLLSAIVGDKIVKNKKGLELGRAESTSGVSSILIQEGFSLVPHPYFGYGMRKLSELTNRSIGSIQKHMKQSKERGHLTTKDKWIYHPYHKKDLIHLRESYPSVSYRLSSYKGRVRERLNDEIIPYLHFSSRRTKYYRLRSQDRAKKRA